MFHLPPPTHGLFSMPVAAHPKTLLPSVVLMALALFATPTHAEQAARPNVLLIMTDDMNYGCCCGEEIARENHCFSPSSEMN